MVRQKAISIYAFISLKKWRFSVNFRLSKTSTCHRDNSILKGVNLSFMLTQTNIRIQNLEPFFEYEIFTMNVTFHRRTMNDFQ